MEVTLTHLADIVALLLGEFADRRASDVVGGGNSLSVEELITPVVEHEARRLTTALINGEIPDEIGNFPDNSSDNSSDKSCWKSPPVDTILDCRAQLAATTDWGDGDCGVGELPDDFLALAHILVAGWSRPLFFDEIGNSGPRQPQKRSAAALVEQLGDDAPLWMRYGDRPIAQVLPPEGSGMPQRLRLAPPGKARILEAHYIPVPRLDGNILRHLPDSLVIPLARSLATLISNC